MTKSKSGVSVDGWGGRRDRVRGKWYGHPERGRLEAEKLGGLSDAMLARAWVECQMAVRMIDELEIDAEIVADLIGVRSLVGGCDVMFHRTWDALAWETFRRGLRREAESANASDTDALIGAGGVSCAGELPTEAEQELIDEIRLGREVFERLPRDGTYVYANGAPIRFGGKGTQIIRALIRKGYVLINLSGLVILRGKAASGNLTGQRGVGRRRK